MRPRLIAVAILCGAAASAVPAQQVMPATVIRRGEAAGPGPLDEPISLILEHAGLLDLTDAQRTSLMNLRRVLRRANDPYLARLDSLRELVGISAEPRRGGEDADKQARLDSLARPVTDTIRINNSAAGLQARAVLDSAQVARLDSILGAGRGGRRGRPPTG